LPFQFPAPVAGTSQFLFTSEPLLRLSSATLELFGAERKVLLTTMTHWAGADRANASARKSGFMIGS
jgi:hypothetical protein